MKSLLDFELDGCSLGKVLRNLPVATAVQRLDAAGTLLFVNEQFVRCFGYTLADIPTVESWALRAYPDISYRREVFTLWDSAVARACHNEGRVESVECRVTCKNSSVRDVIIGAARLGNHLIATLTDVTERRQAEIQLKHATAQIERTAYELTDNIPVGTYTMVQPADGGMGFFSFMSQRFLDICGLDREEARSDPFKAFACVHPDDYDEWVRKNAEVFEKQLPFFGECRVVVNGEVRWITAESRPRPLSDGSTVWEGVLTDITSRREAEEKVRTANERMQLAAEAAGIGFWTRDLATKHEEWDDQMLRLYGLRRDEFDGRWEPYVHPEDLERVQAATTHAAERRQHGEYEYRIVRRDGTIRHVKGLSTVICDAHGLATHELGVNYDITRQKQAEEELAHAREEERRREALHRNALENKLKTSLSAAATVHEIKQPLARILIETQLAVERLQGRSLKPNEMRVYLEEMLAESQRVVDMMGRMKTILQTAQTNIQRFRVAEVVNSAILYSKSLLAQHDAVCLQLGLDHDVHIHGDSHQVQTAVNNLIRNAIEAVATRPIGCRDVSVELRVNASGIAIIVGDNGPGMPYAQVNPLPFETTKPHGTGLGLYLVRTCAENHGGTMTVGRSRLGGAEVRLELPINGPVS